jgi:hypothetical protein
MPFLPPAEYELTGEMAGFKKAVRAGVILDSIARRDDFGGTGGFACQRRLFGCGSAAPWGSFSSCGPDFIGSSRLQAGLAERIVQPRISNSWREFPISGH